MKIILTGNPLTTGQIYRSTQNNRRYMIPKARERKEAYMWEAKAQWKEKPLENDVELDIKLFFGDKRRRDWDNFHKLSMDALEGIVYLDDVQIQKATIEKFYDKDNPRIEIIVV